MTIHSHVAMPDDEDHPDNAVDYNQSSEDEQVLEEQGPTLEMNPEMALTVNPVPKLSANGKDKKETAASRSSVVSAERKAVLDHSDILRMTSDKNYKFIRSLGNHKPQQAGFKNSIYNFDEELDGYTSPGGTVRMTKGVANGLHSACRRSPEHSPLEGATRGLRASYNASRGASQKTAGGIR
jgi:hypothetical protein